jgi:BirA family biotin operon repressor/biotin-[acetyl-CoA-carboxylase] ligase
VLGRDAEATRNISLCRESGFDIRVTEGRAILPRDEDSLVPAWVEAESRQAGWELSVAGFLDLGSTNDEAVARAQTPETLLVYAEHQSSGKGRKGRRWHSPRKEGLYFSLLFRPGQPQNRWPVLTHVASVALVQALEELSAGLPRPLDIDLKWPNDVLLSGKKTAGILLETASAGPGGGFAAVAGVGVNVGAACVPEELREVATSVAAEAGVAVPRRTLLVRYLRNFQELYGLFESGRHAEVLDRWKRRSTMWDGVAVQVVEGSSTRLGVTCGLDELGALRIRMAEGVEETVIAGDVTVRRVAGR